MINSANSGGMFPRGTIEPSESTKFIKGQLAQPNDDKIAFGGSHIAIWRNAKVDLLRFGTFKINGQEYYDTAKGSVPSKEEDVFKAILQATGSDFAVTQRLTKLLQQNTLHLLHSELFGRFNIVSTRTFSAEEQQTHLSVDGKIFKVAQEIIFKMRDLNDIEDETKFSYAKAKIVISGTLEDLIGSPEDHTGIKVKIFHTQEVKGLKAARSAKYQSVFSKQKEPTEFK